MSPTHDPDAPYWLALLGTNSMKRILTKRIIQQWCLAESQPLSGLWDLPVAELGSGLGLTEEEARCLAAVERAVPEQATLLDRLASEGIAFITRVDVAYPDVLVERLPEDSLPYFLFCKGNVALLTQPGIGIMGSHDPTAAQRDVVRDLAVRLAGDGHHVVGGYSEGIGRDAIDAACNAGGPVSIVLPMGIRLFLSTVHRFDQALEQGYCLMMSPFGPDTPSNEVAARGRLGLVAALVDGLILIDPDVSPDRVLLAHQELSPLQRLLLWSRSKEPTATQWGDRGATRFDDSQEAHAAITEMFGVAPAALDQDDGGIDDLQGVEPIIFESAASAIEILGQTGKVPESLAQRLRGGDWTEDDAVSWMDDESSE